MTRLISWSEWRTVLTEGTLEGTFVPGAVGFGWGPHVAALVGIAALAVLGGVLVIRNRLAEYDAGNEDHSRTDEEFLSDREQVHYLVDENGGRMKQSEIVEAVDWSKAKVSRLLAELEDDGEITKLRLGRENLICLEGNEPTASKSSDGPGTD
ncbi:helix-turn-helix transcriptional regulator [Natrialbaceae archaeon A-gly3]